MLTLMNIKFSASLESKFVLTSEFWGLLVSFVFIYANKGDPIGRREQAFKEKGEKSSNNALNFFIYVYLRK